MGDTARKRERAYRYRIPYAVFVVCPGFPGVRFLEFSAAVHSSEFRRRVLSLIAAGRPIREIASDPGGSEQTIYTWRRQDRIDQGLEPGLASAALIEAHRFSTASSS